MDVPVVKADITPDFVTAALRTGGHLDGHRRVRAVAAEPIGTGVGVLGQLFRLTVDYDGRTDAPRTAILKLPSAAAENRILAAQFRFYEREGRFYADVAPTLPVRVPRCYWNHLDPATDTYGLLLEDLGDRRHVDQVAGLAAGHASVALRALARLHATWWGSPRLGDLDWMPTSADPINLAAGPQYRQAWPAFLARVGDLMPPGAVALGERIQQVFEGLMLSTPAVPTVCHGDFRGDNLLFDDRPAARHPVAVLDWQISMRTAGAFDVAYLLSQSMTAVSRQAHERALVALWYAEVAAHVGGDAGTIPEYSWQQAWDDYRFATLATTVYPVLAGATLDLGNERGRRLVAEMGGRAFSTALAHCGEDLFDRAAAALATAIPAQRQSVVDVTEPSGAVLPQ